MVNIERQYLELLNSTLRGGEKRDDRTGVGTRSLFGHHLVADLTDGFPLLTTKEVKFHLVTAELAWFLSGSTNVRDLQELGCHIWDSWADERGELGPIYGVQWRCWPDSNEGCVDQIRALIDSIRIDPYSRRHVVSAWNVDDLEFMSLFPCHPFWQIYVHEPGTDRQRISLHLYQRSADIVVGLPFNIASYALLTHIIAQQCDMGVERLIISLGDSHLYANHIEQAHTQLERQPYNLPRLALRSSATVDNFHPSMAEICQYNSHPKIDLPVAE